MVRAVPYRSASPAKQALIVALYLVVLIGLSASPVAAEIDLEQASVFAKAGFDPGVVHWDRMEAPPGYRRMRLPVVVQQFDSGEFSGGSARIAEFTVIIPFQLPHGHAFDHPALLLAGIGENWQIYLNGRLLRSEMYPAKGGLQVLRVLRNELVSMPGGSIHEGSNVLVFRILGDLRSPRSGLFSGGQYKIGELMNLREQAFEYAPVALISLFLFLGLYHIYLYARTSRFSYGLVYGLFLFAYSVYTMAHSSYMQRFIFDSAAAIRIESTSLFLSAALMAAFMDLLLIGRIALITRIFIAGCAMLVVVQLASLSAGLLVKDAFALFEIPQLFWVIRLLALDFRRELSNHRESLLGLRGLARWWLGTRILFGSNLGALLIGGIAVVTGIAAEAILVLLFQKETNVVVISSLLIFVNMTLLITRRFEESIKNEERSQILLQEQEKRHSLETDLAAVQERERVFADMHDHLGSRLVDLELMLNDPDLTSRDPLWKGKLSERLKQLREGLRNRIALLEDKDVIKRDFVAGLRLVTYRRYQNAGRSVRILVNDAAESAMAALRAPDRAEFFAVLTEITTNDLKYGEGTSTWHLDADDCELRITCKNTALEGAGMEVGQGTETIRRRIASLGGSVLREHADGIWTVEVTLPRCI